MLTPDQFLLLGQLNSGAKSRSSVTKCILGKGSGSFFLSSTQLHQLTLVKKG